MLGKWFEQSWLNGRFWRQRNKVRLKSLVINFIRCQLSWQNKKENYSPGHLKYIN